MSRYILDTDVFSHYLRQHPNLIRNILAHLADDLGLSVVSVGELWDGWASMIRKAKTPDQAAAAYDRLTETVNELKNWPVVSFSAGAIRRYAVLKAQKLNVGANDFKIAATALETGAVVITHNGRDFTRVPGLAVEDWL